MKYDCAMENANSLDVKLETYRALRRRARQTPLDAADTHAYADVRREVSAAVLWFQCSQTAPGKRMRASARARVHIPITLRMDEWETDTYVEDISQGGCALVLSRAPSETRIPFRLELHKRLTVCGVAEVVTVRPRGTGYHVSLRFQPLGDEANAYIEDIVLDTLIGA